MHCLVHHRNHFQGVTFVYIHFPPRVCVCTLCYCHVWSLCWYFASMFDRIRSARRPMRFWSCYFACACHAFCSDVLDIMTVTGLICLKLFGSMFCQIGFDVPFHCCECLDVLPMKSQCWVLFVMVLIWWWLFALPLIPFVLLCGSDSKSLKSFGFICLWGGLSVFLVDREWEREFKTMLFLLCFPSCVVCWNDSVWSILSSTCMKESVW